MRSFFRKSSAHRTSLQPLSIGGLLAGDIALVTGAARGIGAAIAQAIAREGARVFLTDMAGEKVGAVAQELENSGSQTAFLTADLKDPASSDKIVDAAIDRFGPVSILVHAASPGFSGSVLELSDSTWNEMIAVNLQAAYRIAKRLGSDMRTHGTKGRMLFITSLHAKTPRGHPAYSAAKAGMVMMMKELAKALGPDGIRVNAIAPGLIAANWYPNANPTVQATPLRRIGTPEEVAEMAIVLLSDRLSSFVTGTTVTVDGGLSLYNWVDN
jgi:3-oxoacyl-[acyl-carrier protein] reductase